MTVASDRADPITATGAPAIWAILCQIDPAGLAEYLDWFHGVHIPDKLDRPGYTWAAHYALSGPAADGPPAYLALFGGTSTRVFLDPSPAQLKTRQDDTTRRMMAFRSRSQSLVLSEEWRISAAASLARGPAPFIEVTLLELDGADEDYGAWLVQEEMPALVGRRGWSATTKLLAAAGRTRHVTIHEFPTEAQRAVILAARQKTEWSHRWASRVRGPAASPLLGTRIWPVQADRQAERFSSP